MLVISGLLNSFDFDSSSVQPIPQGICTGVTSLCAISGFALESRCHTGQVILYDTVQKLGWSVDIRNHAIKVLVDRLFGEDAEWKPEFNEDTDKGEGETLFNVLRWPFGWPGKKSQKPEKDNPQQLREVPLARPAVEVEGSDGVCTVYINISFLPFPYTDDDPRIASVGSMDVSKTVMFIALATNIQY